MKQLIYVPTLQTPQSCLASQYSNAPEVAASEYWKKPFSSVAIPSKLTDRPEEWDGWVE